MSARTKLNFIYLIAIGTLSIVVGLVSKSITVLIVCFGLLISALLLDGSIRPQPRRR